MQTLCALNASPEEVAVQEIALQLDRCGAVLLRGAGWTPAALESLSKKMFRRFHLPANRAVLKRDDGDGFSSLVRKESRLLGHAEGYYRPCLAPPDVCIFFCEQAPRVGGGETFLIDGAELFRALPPDLAGRLEAEGVIYESFWERERWQNEFGTTDTGELRRLLQRDGRCEYTLNQADELHLYFKSAAILVDRQHSKRFINGMLAHLPSVDHPRYASVPISAKPSNRIHWGRGGLIDNEAICAIIDAHDAVLHKHRWMDGDLLFLDNHKVLHGREVMEAPDERILYSRFGFRE